MVSRWKGKLRWQVQVVVARGGVAGAGGVGQGRVAPRLPLLRGGGGGPASVAPVLSTSSRPPPSSGTSGGTRGSSGTSGGGSTLHPVTSPYTSWLVVVAPSEQS